MSALTLTEIAERIAWHLLALEREESAGVALAVWLQQWRRTPLGARVQAALTAGGVPAGDVRVASRRFFRPTACRSGTRIAVKSIDFHEPVKLTRAQALAYLQELDATAAEPGGDEGG